MKRRLMAALAASLVALTSLAPAALAQEVAGSGPRVVEDELFGLRSVVPEAWRPLGQGIHARGAPPQDPALIALQSAPLAPSDLWPALLPQLGLEEAPAQTGERSTGRLEWDLFAFDVELPGLTLAVELALAEEEGVTYLVLLQAPGEDFPALRESVFLPAVDALEPLEPQPTVDPSTLPYEVEAVAFPGGSDGVQLAGTLTVPRGEGAHPAIVLLTGSGAQDRDESLAPVTALKPFALIADALTRSGVAVLRYDDRGVGESTGVYEAATVDDLTADARAALDFLASRPDIDPTRTGLLGHSEGGIYAATIAADDPRVAFVVGMAPPTVDGVTLLVAQYEAIAKASGLPPEEAAAQRAFAEAVFPAARDGDVERVEAVIREHFGAYWDRQDAEMQALLGDRQAYADMQVDLQVDLYTSDWFRSLLATDASEDWSRVQVPAYGIFGALDVQVPPELNEPALREAFAAAGNAAGETIILPGANHLFQAAETGAPAEYGLLEPEFTPDFLPTLSAWVIGQVGLPD